jgi:hypothetical protein
VWVWVCVYTYVCVHFQNVDRRVFCLHLSEEQRPSEETIHKAGCGLIRPEIYLLFSHLP